MNIRHWIDNRANQYLLTLPSVKNLWEKWEDFQRSMQDLHTVRRRSEDFIALYAALKNSMRPVVLFKGTMFLPGRIYLDKPEGEQQDTVAFGSYSWAEKADENLRISIQPNVEIELESIQVLNGPYDIVTCVLCNVDLIATNNGVFPPGEAMPVPKRLARVTPANRIQIILRERV